MSFNKNVYYMCLVLNFSKDFVLESVLESINIIITYLICVLYFFLIFINKIKF